MPDFQYLGPEGKGLLESALAQPAQTFDGRYVYPTMVHKSAAMLWSIVKNHPFTDGNKRMGLVAVHIFLLMNGYAFYSSRDDAVTMCLRIAGGGEPIDLAAVG